jgi:hypothetical protein
MRPYRTNDVGDVVDSYAFLNSGSLAVARDGVSTALFTGATGADFGAGPVTGVPWEGGSRYLVQFDATGTMLPQPTSGTSNVYEHVVSDPGGGLWAECHDNSTSGPPAYSLVKLTPSGEVAWSTSLPSSCLVAAGANDEVAYDGVVDSRVLMYSPDGGLTASHPNSLPFAFTGAPSPLAVDGHGNAILAVTFDGTAEKAADGGETYSDSPRGAGYLAFDSTGTLSGAGVWSTGQAYPAVAVDPSGNVVLAGWTDVDGGAGVSLSFVKLARDAGLSDSAPDGSSAD